VSGLVGILGCVLSVLWYLSIPKQVDATANTWEASNYWATTATDQTNNYKL